ncbi:MAG: cytochrome b/b6 domain-containing protein [Alphaproteobacteria bacterium]|nr:cytochrome b/b6 domain-containing protein [Alphaproteobacteria bacterium]
MSAQAKHTVTGGEVTSPPTVEVWDVFVRLFHWSLVATFAIAFVSADEWEKLHNWAGYAALGLVSTRLVWGLIGTRHARFSSFVRAPAATLAYLRDMMRGSEKRYLGHNPAGALMILALLAGIAGLGLTGWMMTLDAYWQDEWLEEVHEALANGMLVLIALHIAGVVIASIRHGENLMRAMITGHKAVDR